MTEKKLLMDEILRHWINEYVHPQLPEEKRLLQKRIHELTKSIQKASDKNDG
jgi:hypothetical protein